MGPKILVVSSRSELQQVLLNAGLGLTPANLEIAPLGLEVLNIAQYARPDVIIMEMGSAFITGLDLAERLHRVGVSIPIILLVEESSEEQVLRALRARIFDYVRLPLDPLQLSDAVWRALEQAIAPPPDRFTLNLTALLEDAATALVVVDAQNRVVWNNATARALFDKGGSQNPVGRWLYDVTSYEPLIALVDNAREHHNLQDNLRLDDGRTFRADATALANGECIIAMQDITIFDEANRAKSELITNISHDLRSPLTGILSYVELMRRFGELNPRQTEFAEQVKASVHSITTLVSDLLELGRIEAGLDVQREPVAVEEMLSRVAVMLRGKAQLKSQELLVETAGELPPVLGNPIRLRQAVYNLVENAIKYTPDEGRVTLHAYHEEGQVFITVTDSGVGIPASEQPYIFDKYYRASTTAGQDGSGLGLSIVKTIIEAHDGRIWVTSTPGEGSVFTVVLPAQQAEAASSA